jgi:SUR7/PalI family
LHLGLSDIGWPSGIQDGLDSLSTLVSTLFVLYIVGISTAGLNICTAPLTFFQQRAQLRLCGKGLACISFVSLLAASIIITFVQLKAVDLINKDGNSIGVYADGGERYMVFTWLAVLIMFLGAAAEMLRDRIVGWNMLEG